MAMCPQGYYCPAGTGFNWQECPPGTYNNDTGLGAMSECKACPGGWYCDHYAASEPTGKCDPGYYCEYGMDRVVPTGMDNITDVNGTCVLPGNAHQYISYMTEHFIHD